MKTRTFILTFVAFSMAQALRVAYSYNKKYIIKKFDVDQLFLGFLDSIYWISVAIGAIFHFTIIKKHRFLQSYLGLSILTNLSIALFPVCSLFFEEDIISNDIQKDAIIKKAILIISMVIFGLSSFAVWPLNFKLVTRYYDVQKQGKWLGIWSAGWEVGNMYGLFSCQILISSWNVRWQLIIIIFAILNLSCCLLVYLFLENPGSSKNLHLQEQINEDDHQITTTIFLKNCKQNIKNKELRIYILINGLISALFTALLFWIPTYIVSLKHQTIAGYFAIIIDVAAIIGSFLLGMTYQKQSSTCEQNNSVLHSLKQFFSEYLPFIVLALTILTTFAWIVFPPQILIYGSLIAVLGFFLGGLFNCMHSNDLIIEAHNNQQQTQMLAVFVNITNSIIVSISCILIGFSIYTSTIYNNNLRQNNNIAVEQQDPYVGMFYAILITQCIILFLLYLRKHYKQQRLSQEYSIVHSIQTQQNSKQQQIKMQQVIKEKPQIVN